MSYNDRTVVQIPGNALIERRDNLIYVGNTPTPRVRIKPGGDQQIKNKNKNAISHFGLTLIKMKVFWVYLANETTLWDKSNNLY